MIYIGIDNGVNGGLATYNEEGQILEVKPMPTIKVIGPKGNRNEYNIPEIVDWFNQFRGITKMVIVEKAQPFPGMGAHQTFVNARNFGIMEGIIATTKLPYMVVHPKTWQKRMFEGMPKQDTKQASVATAIRLFPNNKFTATDKATKLHDGMTDASLMAYYGYLLHK